MKINTSISDADIQLFCVHKYQWYFVTCVRCMRCNILYWGCHCLCCVAIIVYSVQPCIAFGERRLWSITTAHYHAHPSHIACFIEYASDTVTIPTVRIGHFHNTNSMDRTLSQYQQYASDTVTIRTVRIGHCHNTISTHRTLSQYQQYASDTVTLPTVRIGHCHNTNSDRTLNKQLCRTDAWTTCDASMTRGDVSCHAQYSIFSIYCTVYII